MVLGIPNPVGFTLFGDDIVTATKTKTKKRALRARIGDLAIVRFDDAKTVGLVMECDSGPNRCYRVVQWDKSGGRTEIHYRWVDACRLTRAMPKMLWEGKLSELTIDLVDPVYE